MYLWESVPRGTAEKLSEKGGYKITVERNYGVEVLQAS